MKQHPGILLLLPGLVIALPFLKACSQERPEKFRAMFYNVENFFDPFDDSLTRDEEYTPQGSRRWTYSRFMEKAVKIARVIIACGDPDPPALVGLSEVENHFVLEKLIYETPLKGMGYRVVHLESPDPRGIDVALLYRKNLFRVDSYYTIPVRFADTTDKTRDILVVHGVLGNYDTVSVMVCHWPSRYGGAGGSEYKRITAASLLKNEIDRLFGSNACKNILVMGDFNDEPGDPSIRLLTSGYIPESDQCEPKIVNLMPVIVKPSETGTIKHEGHWGVFDQIMVSQGLFEGKGRLKIENKKAAVCTAAFLLEADESHLGVKPFRTFLGPAYHGGFSDHLPVYLDIIKD